MGTVEKRDKHKKRRFVSPEEKVGFIHSKKASVYPQLKMLIRLLKVIPFKTLKKYMSHIKQITGSNKQSVKSRRTEISA